MGAVQTRGSPLFPLAGALVCGGVGTLSGLFAARARLAAQDYETLGFERSAFFLLRDGLHDGTVSGLWFGAFVAAALGLAVGLTRGDLTAARVARWPASRLWAAWVSAFASVGTTAMLIAIEREREWVAAGDIVHAIGSAVALWLVLECLGRYARKAESDSARATVVASLAGLLLAFPALTWLARDVLALGPGRLPLAPTVLALVVSAIVFVWVRARAAAQLAGREQSFMSGPAGVGAVLGGVLVALGLNFGMLEGALGAPTLTASQPLDVVVIGIDTLRADATSLYGPSLHGRDTTPNLRKLAERGVLFENAVSQAPWTMPSFGAILTGRYPHEHGGFSLSGALRESEVLLPEALREAGYTTRGVVSHTYLGATHGFTQGYEQYDASNALGHRAITSKSVTDLAIRSLEDAGDKPLFLFTHYFDAHYEYMDQRDWSWADEYKGWLRNENDYENLIKNRQMVNAEENRWLVDLYEEEIAYVDREVGRLVDALEKRGKLDRTLIIVVADHGEEFLDHDSYGHTTTLWQEQLHVPLLVVPPGRTAPARVKGIVETRTVFGTVLEAIGLDFADAARKRSLLHKLGPDGNEVVDPQAKAFSILWLPDANVSWGKRMRISSLREGRWKLIRHFTWEKTLLFDLESDPGEKNDLAASEPERVKQMLPLLEAWTTEQDNRGAARKVALDKDEIRKLKELGYL